MKAEYKFIYTTTIILYIEWQNISIQNLKVNIN